VRKRDGVTLWPVYFDSLKTRREGRRLPKKLCIPSPNIGVIEGALKNLGLKYEVFPDASHPRLPWAKSGFIIVKRNGRSKGRILREVAAELVRGRT